MDSVNPKDAYGDKKPDLSLIPPTALLEEARVMQLGAKKYGPYNWRAKRVRARVYTAAAMRHILAWQDGVDIDDESGANHLAHARACLGILLDAMKFGFHDDRTVPKPTTLSEIQVCELTEGEIAMGLRPDHSLPYACTMPGCPGHAGVGQYCSYGGT